MVGMIDNLALAQRIKPVLNLHLEFLPSTGAKSMKSKTAIAANAASLAMCLSARLPMMATAKGIGWAIYAAGFVVWVFGYLSAGHAPAVCWGVVMPWWISSFVPNLEAELGLALMSASMIPDLLAGRTEASVMRAIRLLPGLILAGGGLLGWWRRRQKIA